jgi:copper homeostasis protein
MLVEVCANSLESALVAERAGADRIELCSELAVGGITPSYGLLKAVMEQLSIPVHVLIRPRSGDFSYSNEEFEIMLTDIKCCIDLGVKGIVAGVLHKDFELDEERTRILRAASGDLKFTFHRAFDWVKDPVGTMKLLESMGVDSILSSGQQEKAIDGIDVMKELHRNTSSIQIMPGSGVNINNVDIFREAGFNAVHLSGTTMIKKLQRPPKVSMNSSSFLSDDHYPVTQLNVILDVVAKVK